MENEEQKGWKKVTENKTFTTYQKGIDEDMFVTILRQTYNPEAWGYKKFPDYIVSVGTHSVKIIEKHFKTKSQAMNYAKKYMGEHK